MKRVSFHINKSFDEFMTEQFLDEKGGGINFGKGIVKLHPALREAKKRPASRKRIISRYFDEYYKTHRKDISARMAVIRRKWREVERKYAKVTENLFGGYKFPQGMYAAYASIVNCNPRFLDSKTFQLFYKKEGDSAVHTIAHELLHFIFFDFVEKKMKKEISRLSKSELWDLSEVFNVIVLRSAPYRGIIDQRRVVPYPAHRKFLKKFEEAYEQSKNIRSFIEKGARLVKNK